MQLNGKLPKILSTTNTILSICYNQAVGDICYYTYEGNLVPSDYPQALLDAGAHYRPIVIIYKPAYNVATILIYDAVNTNGFPRGIQGYCNMSSLFWGNVF